LRLKERHCEESGTLDAAIFSLRHPELDSESKKEILNQGQDDVDLFYLDCHVAYAPRNDVQPNKANLKL
jgi:hypothetical protein